jgi:hypothetical protein
MSDKWSPTDVSGLLLWYDANEGYYCGKFIVPNKANKYWRYRKAWNLIKWRARFWIYSRLYKYINSLMPPWSDSTRDDLVLLEICKQKGGKISFRISGDVKILCHYDSSLNDDDKKQVQEFMNRWVE